MFRSFVLGAISLCALVQGAMPNARPARPSPISPPSAARYALVVAIDSYPDPLNNLPSYKEDVAAMTAALTKRFGFPAANVKVLRNSAATREAILDGFRTHLSKAGPDGAAVFYFVGHGLQLDKNYSVKENEDSAVDQALFVWGSGGRGTIVLDDELNVLFRDLTAGRRVAIIDACYSGTSLRAIFSGWIKRTSAFLFDDSPPQREYVMAAEFSSDGKPADIPRQFVSDSQTLEEIDSLPIVFMSAAGEAETARSVENFPAAPHKHAVFSYFLAIALRTSPEGTSFAALRDAVSRRLAAREGCVSDASRCQTPQLRGRLRTRSLVDILGRP